MDSSRSVPVPPPLPTPRPKGPYLLRAWRGEFGLGYAFSMHLLMLGIVPFGLAYLALGPATQWEPSQALLAPLILWPIAALLLTWQIVGVYRSAQRALRSRRSDGTTPVLAIGFLFALACGALWIFGAYGAPQVGRSINAYTGSPDLAPATVTVLGNGTVVEFDGGIGRGSARRLEEALAGLPGAKTLYINSAGGIYSEARAMEAIVRRHRLDTFVDKECSGAAMFVFLAGERRFVTGEAQFSFKSDLHPLTKALIHGDPLEERLRELGADETFLGMACFYPRDQAFVPSDKELVAQKVATSLVNPLDYPLDAVDRAALSEEWLKAYAFKNELNEAYADGNPEGFDAFMKEALQNLRDGRPLGEVMDALDAKVKVAERAAAGHPSYAALDKIVDWAIQLLANNKDYTPGTALEFFFRGPSLTTWDRDYIVHHVAHYPFDMEKAVWVELLKDPKNSAGPANSGARARIMEIAKRYCAGDADWTQLNRGIPKAVFDQQAVAAIWAQTLVEIRAQPEEERWPLEAYLCIGYRR